MPKDTQQVDHRAEALRLLGFASDERNPPYFGDQLLFEALIHSNLAIAQGQERVAEELQRARTSRGLRASLESLRADLKPSEFSTSDASDDPLRAELISAIDRYLDGEILGEGRTDA